MTRRLLLLGLLLAAPALAYQPPEAGTGRYAGSTALARQQLVVTAHPLATAAALDILRQGGSAMDAAITAQAVLGQVEPQSSGFGGGGFLVHAHRGVVTAIDGRETAPAAVDSHHFLQADGRPMHFREALGKARAVGIPGLVALLAEGHARWGRLPWADTLAPAIRLAADGAPVSHRQHQLSARDPLLAEDANARAHFYDDQGEAYAPGVRRAHPAYARLLQRLASAGPADFYRGETAHRLVTALRAAGSPVTAADWAGYQARVSPALCVPLRRLQACSAPPPAGGLTLLQGLAIWLQAEDNARPPWRQFLPGRRRALDLTPASLHRLLEAQRLAFADREAFAADPAFVEVPVSALLNEHYLRARASLIGAQALPVARAGLPADFAGDPAQALTGTTHLTIVDRDGHWISMTTSIESAFGSRLMIDGLLMNNQLTDFSFLPERDGRPVANRIEGGKRPRSAMSPVIVLNDRGEPLLAAGSAGGARIIGYVARPVSAWLMGVRDAGQLVRLPQVLARGEQIEVETTLPMAVGDTLRAYGHQPQRVDMTSGTHLVLRHGRGLQGAADPRREGRAAGD